MMKGSVAALAIMCAALSGCAPSAAEIAPTGSEWPGFGGVPGEQRFSALTQVTAQNVNRLGLVWSFDLPIGNSVSAPVEAGGVIYTATGYSVVRALDGVSGKLLWTYDPQAPERSGIKLRQGWGIRGLAYDKGRIFVGTQDGRLIALNAADGKELWSVLTTEPGDSRFITGAPRVFGSRVIIGHAGADGGPNRGYVTAYDTATGQQLWRFFTVPGDPAKGFENKAMEAAAKTWSGEWWKFGGGGSVWNAITYDPELDRIYLGTGNGYPWNQKLRDPKGGDNLYLCSIVALDAATGRYVWHYQVNPGETWDYNAAMDMVVATLPIGGKPRKVLMQAPKNGFFYVIDRETGKLISADAIAKVTWATGIDPVTGRPNETPNARFKTGPVELWPGTQGAHSWLPMAFSPITRLVYVPKSERPNIMEDAPDLASWRPSHVNKIDGGVSGNFEPKLPGADRSELIAWDPVARRVVWRVETPGVWAGGVIATAGNLVFQGQLDGSFNAYDARTGQRRWSFNARSPVLAPPITWAAKGRQYITVLTGSGASGAVFGRSQQQFNLRFDMARRVLTFALDAKGKLPPTPPPAPLVAPADPDFRPDPALALSGRIVFDGNCSGCHGFTAIGAGHAPDLRTSAIPLDPGALDAVVRGGALVPAGMPRFEEFTDEQMTALRHYIRTRAADLRAGRKE